MHLKAADAEIHPVTGLKRTVKSNYSIKVEKKKKRASEN